MDESLLSFGPEDCFGFDDNFSPSPFDPAESYPMDDYAQNQENAEGTQQEEQKDGV